LIGKWEGEGGLDTAFAHASEAVVRTPYLERVTFQPFGPVVNGDQSIYGLDYSTAMWRGSEENPFHTEVGYWLWDAAAGEITRAFVVPRGISVLAGGTASPDATEFTLHAALGEPGYAIGQNRYLSDRAKTVSYTVTVTFGPDSWSYEEETMLEMREFSEPFAHTDHNTLHRVA
jgi:hypothetical protein